jgi:hypothetical protein
MYSSILPFWYFYLLTMAKQMTFNMFFIFSQNLILGYMTKTLNQIKKNFLHQNQNIFFSNIGNQNIFLGKKHNPPPPPPPLKSPSPSPTPFYFKGVIRIHISKDRSHNGQRKKYKQRSTENTHRYTSGNDHLTWRGGRGGYVFFLKKYSDSQCCWKKYSDFGDAAS